MWGWGRKLSTLGAGMLLAALVVATSANALPAGERHVKVLITHWADQPGTYPFTVEHVRDEVFYPVAGDPAGNGNATANGYFQAVSGGASSLVETGGIQQVPSTLNSTDAAVTGCNQNAVLSDVIAQSGITEDVYDHVIVATPPMPCPGSGWAEIPGNRVFLNGKVIWRLVAHEMTHNYGARHAGACTVVHANGDCDANSYGDPFDIMGASTGSLAGFPSGWNLERLGLISPGPPSIVHVTGDGTYNLHPVNDPAATGSPKVLGISRP
ncbi:MAG: hypothetical protein AB7G37_13870, partial [Solirubrobacteraceae bacterium]